MRHDPTHIFYSDTFTAAAYAFDTTRKAGWVAESLDDRPIPGVRLVEPGPLTEAELIAVHAPE